MDAAADWHRDRRAIDAALQADPVSVDDVLAALALVAWLRTDLDRAEERLITLAREHRNSWQRIATALGLHSRQAAEQRWLRLRAAAARDPAEERARRQRQQFIDTAAGAPVADLRVRVSALHAHLARRTDWRAHETAAGLARQTLAAAADAPPGALYDLARLAVRDLATIPARVLGPQTAAALARVAAHAGRQTPG